MEENERELIRSRLTCLIKNIRCTAEFLMYFHEKRIFTFSEIQEIAGKKVDSEKAVHFLMLIQTRTNGFPLLKEGLLKFKQSGALNVLTVREDLNSEPALEEIQSHIANLSLEPTTASSHKRNISFDVFPPVVSFCGRARELKQLHQMILRSQGVERIAVASQLTLVSGLGGIGKTQLVKEYVRVNGKEFDGNVLWMNAESEESLKSSFQRLAKEKLNLPTEDGNGREMTAKCVSEAVYRYFEGAKALCVLDNAEKAPWLKQFMPTVGQSATLFVLFTSREREWDRGIEILELDGLLEDDAVCLVQQGLGIHTNDAVQVRDIKNLAQSLQCFPLALQQAIAYIYEQRKTLKYSIKHYLKEFQNKQNQMLAFKEEGQLCDESFTATTATTWRITVDKIKNDLKNGKLAGLILNIVAYLGADNIKRSLFYRITSVRSGGQVVSVNKEQIIQAVRLLVNYSMLNGRDSQSILSIHRLVQSVTRSNLARDGMEENCLKVALQLLQRSDGDDFPAENIAHALIVWRYSFKYNQLIKSNSMQINNILWKIREVGHHEEGVRFGNEALKNFEKVLGENHIEYLMIKRSIGLILNQQGYVNKAISVFQDILIKANAQHGENSELSLLTNESLGNSLRRSGNYNEAQKILKEVFEKSKTITNDNYTSTLVLEENYGLALMESGNLNEAENIFQRLCKVYFERANENIANIVGFQNNLSNIYSQRGDNEKALEIRKEIYEKLSPVWGKNVDLFATICCNLGNSLNKVGQHQEALQILEENIEKITERLGSQHLRILDIQQAIGRTYCCLGNYNKALDIFQSFHQDFLLISGEDNFRSLNAGIDLAVTLSLLGNHSQALSKFQEILSKMETLLGNENYYVLIGKWELALAFERSGENMQIALSMLKTVKPALMSIVGGDSLIVEKITNDISRIEKTMETLKARI